MLGRVLLQIFRDPIMGIRDSRLDKTFYQGRPVLKLMKSHMDGAWILWILPINFFSENQNKD